MKPRQTQKDADWDGESTGRVKQKNQHCKYGSRQNSRLGRGKYRKGQAEESTLQVWQPAEFKTGTGKVPEGSSRRINTASMAAGRIQDWDGESTGRVKQKNQHCKYGSRQNSRLGRGKYRKGQAEESTLQVWQPAEFKTGTGKVSEGSSRRINTASMAAGRIQVKQRAGKECKPFPALL